MVLADVAPLNGAGLGAGGETGGVEVAFLLEHRHAEEPVAVEEMERAVGLVVPADELEPVAGGPGGMERSRDTVQHVRLTAGAAGRCMRCSGGERADQRPRGPLDAREADGAHRAPARVELLPPQHQAGRRVEVEALADLAVATIGGIDLSCRAAGHGRAVVDGELPLVRRGGNVGPGLLAPDRQPPVGPLHEAAGSLHDHTRPVAQGEHAGGAANEHVVVVLTGRVRPRQFEDAGEVLLLGGERKGDEHEREEGSHSSFLPLLRAAAKFSVWARDLHRHTVRYRVAAAVDRAASTSSATSGRAHREGAGTRRIGLVAQPPMSRNPEGFSSRLRAFAPWQCDLFAVRSLCAYADSGLRTACAA